ncbi:hypothetical protein AB0F45_38255 [Streptomyces achromogenes]|uniref:hypothetical protein n=1 Tax=Streptomyces achromogenes TaxID=67255 RepID=UPI0033E9DAF0
MSLLLTTAVHRCPIEFLLAFSMSLAASCVFPALVYSFLYTPPAHGAGTHSCT